MTRRSVNITAQQAKWLDKHPEINLSGLVRACINGFIEGHEKEEETVEDLKKEITDEIRQMVREEVEKIAKGED